MTGARLWTIPAGAPFAAWLVEGVLARYGEAMARDPLALSRMTLFLPTRRSIATVQEAFLRARGGAASLLPTLIPLGEVDEDDLDAVGLPQMAGETAAATEVPQSLDGTRRTFMLARLVQQFADRSGALADDEGHLSAAQAIRLAAELGRLLDEIETEGLDMARLADLVRPELARHWQETLDFLGIVTTAWPAVLSEMGMIGARERQRLLVDRLVERWRLAPPGDPVIVAGSTGSVPATARLMAAVAALPEGAVILPGLDRSLDEAVWAAIPDDPTHPQSGLARLLAEDLRAGRSDVQDWQDPGGASSPEAAAARRRLLSEAMRPAATTEAWRRYGRDHAKEIGTAVEGLHLVTCRDAREEATAIAVLLREVLETPSKTAALVTPDRDLARRVSSEMGRWGLVVDDSSGMPLADRAPMVFLRLLADAVSERLAPVPLLALLKHPLAAGGLPIAEFRRRTRLLDRLVLRGPRPAPGLSGLLEAIAGAGAGAVDGGLRPEDQSMLSGWISATAAVWRPFAELLNSRDVPLADLLAAHVAAAEALAATDEEAGADRLWARDDGNAAAETLADLASAAEEAAPIGGGGYPAVFEALLDGRSHRARFGTHPRLSILGTLEARLTRFDRVVLGGLNEGSWPPEPPADPWMNRQMRRVFGLPAPERRISLAAHDFMMQAAGPEVFMTRAARVGGSPTVPSRWLLRLGAVLDSAGHGDRLGVGETSLLGLVSTLDRPTTRLPALPPEPRPPLADRPRRLSVTRIEAWARNPYEIFARHILGLYPLQPIDADLGAADRGTIIHDALDTFVRELEANGQPQGLGQDPAERLLAAGRAAFAGQLARPSIRAFWWPRFCRVAEWFIERERLRATFVRRRVSEAKGSAEIPIGGVPFTLYGTADRLDLLEDGGVEIIDYKTGAPPTDKEVAAGWAPQLPLEGVILSRDGFEGLEGMRAERLSYWRLTGGAVAGQVREVGGDIAALVAEVEGRLVDLVTRFMDEDTPYLAKPDPHRAQAPSDYDHLARLKAWMTEAGE